LYFKVSSEKYFDWIDWYLDGDHVAGWSGEKSWTQHILKIPPGSHTVMWEYNKDSDGKAGSDCGWVDKVVYTPRTNKPVCGALHLLLAD
jgi:hypothetical protein